jgi:hypothetical protein
MGVKKAKKKKKKESVKYEDFVTVW